MLKILKLVVLLFFVVCLAYMSFALYVKFFVEQHQGLRGSIELEVDGTKYWVQRFADINRQGQVASSTLVVTFRAYSRSVGSTEFLSQRGTTVVRFRLNDGRVIAKTDTLYFIHEGRIVFEKGFQELGIDASHLGADLEVMLDYLQPILEEVIRENVQPQVPEIEEQ